MEAGEGKGAGHRFSGVCGLPCERSLRRNCGGTGDIPFFGTEVWKDAGMMKMHRDETMGREIFATFQTKF